MKRPAAALDVSFEPGLDDALIEATREQAGALPLLSDTLDILWEEMQARGDGVLRWSRPLKEGVDVAMKLGERADGFVKAHQEQEALIRRRFRGLDIDPAYVDVAIDRWTSMTGGVPERVEGGGV